MKRRLLRKATLLGVAMYSLYGCATLTCPPSSPNQAAWFDRQLSECAVADGTAHLVVRRGEQDIFAGDADWIFPGTGMDVRILSPMGSPLAQLEILTSAGGTSGSGRFSSVATPQALDDAGGADLTVEDGFLHINGNMTGLTLHDLRCFLQLRIPRRWLRDACAVVGSNPPQLRVAAGERHIVVTRRLAESSAPAVGGGAGPAASGESVCAEVTVGFWRWHTATYCLMLTSGQKPYATLESRGFLIKLTALEGGFSDPQL